MTETKTRTIVKTIVWRLICIFGLAYWTGLGGSLLINIFFMTAYYFHERIWLLINWGKEMKATENTEAAV